MNKNKIGVEWSSEKSLEEAKAYLLFRAKHLYFEPRKISNDDCMVDLLIAASNQFHLLNETQKLLKNRFSRVEWKAIEMALEEVTEDKSAGPTLAEGIAAEFETNREIQKLQLNLKRTIKKIESLSLLERDAIVDAGRKLRGTPGTELYDLLGHQLVTVDEGAEFWQ